MSIATRVVCILGLVTAGITGAAFAQDAPRVELELTRTDERIALAQSVVAGSENPRARGALDMAVQLQSEARRVYMSGQFPMALRLTLDARARADVAIATVQGLPDPDRVRAQVERTHELLDRARERVEECAEDRARAMLRGAVELQGRAEAALGSRRYLAALRLTMSARERGWRALRICNVHEDVESSADRALRRTDDVLDRARRVVSERGDERAAVALDQALDLQQRAQAEFHQGHETAALRLTQSSRTAAYRALRLAGGRF